MTTRVRDILLCTVGLGENGSARMSIGGVKDLLKKGRNHLGEDRNLQRRKRESWDNLSTHQIWKRRERSRGLDRVAS